METGVRLTVVSSQTEADIICALLRENEIACGDRAADVATYGTSGSGGWREVLVKEDQLEDAQAVLEAAQAPEEPSG
jgi:type III secretory pathway lipoprotein EscJ